MRSKVLERRIVVLSEFIELWVMFKQGIDNCAASPEVSEEDEQRFLQLKSLVARKQQAVMEVGVGGKLPDREIEDIVSHSVSLKHIGGTSDLMARKLEKDWHEAYIMLNRAFGSLENQQAELARRNAFVYFLGKLLKSRLFWLLAVVLALALLYSRAMKNGDGGKQEGAGRPPVRQSRGRRQESGGGGIGGWLKDFWDRILGRDDNRRAGSSPFIDGTLV